MGGPPGSSLLVPIVSGVCSKNSPSSVNSNPSQYISPLETEKEHFELHPSLDCIGSCQKRAEAAIWLKIPSFLFCSFAHPERTPFESVQHDFKYRNTLFIRVPIISGRDSVDEFSVG